LAALIDGDELVIVQLEEGNDALAFAVRSLDIAAGAADGCPRTAEAAGPFRKVGILRDAALHAGLDAVVHLVEVAGGKLAVRRAGSEERGRARAEAAALVERIEAGDPVLAVLRLVEEEAHGDAHPEELRRLDAARRGFVCLIDDEVAVVERLDAEIVE